MVDFRNPYGLVQLADGGTPRTLTIKARANISGGYWVNGSTAQGVVSSGANSYAAGDIEGYPVATQVGSEAIGFAISDIASGTYGTIVQRGIIIAPAASGTKIGSIYCGNGLLAGSAGTVVPLGSSTLIAGPAASAKAWQVPVGRALSQGNDDGEYIIVSVNI